MFIFKENVSKETPVDTKKSDNSWLEKPNFPKNFYEKDFKTRVTTVSWVNDC